MASRLALATRCASVLLAPALVVPLSASGLSAAGPVSGLAAAGGVQRWGSDDPIASGIAVYEQGRSVYGDTVVVTRVDDYADGIAATPLAAALKAPVLLTSKNVLDSRVLQAVQRHGVRRAVVVGGPNAVSDAAAAQLARTGLHVQRVAGGNRSETARAVADEVLGVSRSTSAPVFVATGLSFPDALSAGAAAAKAGGVVVLSNGPVLDGPTLAFLRSDKTREVLAVGGAADRAVQAAGLRSVSLAGRDRYHTAQLVAQHGFSKPANVVMTSGLTFAHSLAASAYAAQLKAPLLLTLPTSLPAGTRNYLAAAGSAHVVVVGGARSVGEQVMNAVRDAGRGMPPSDPGRTGSSEPESEPGARSGPGAPGPATAIDAAEREVFALTNAQRVKHGKAPLAWDACLAAAARNWSMAMGRPGGRFEHSPANRGAECSEPFTGENIAMGYDSPADAMLGWMNSPGHRANILHDYDSIGVGIAVGADGQKYYTQIFAANY